MEAVVSDGDEDDIIVVKRFSPFRVGHWVLSSCHWDLVAGPSNQISDRFRKGGHTI